MLLKKSSLLAWFLGLGLLAGPQSSIAQSRSETPLTGEWRLWLDQKATWQNDPLFIPPVELSKLPVNPPTGGWGPLFAKSLPSADAGKILADPALSMNVVAPATVEEFFWDAIMEKKRVFLGGDYLGVSWWGTDFTSPALAEGKRIKLFFSEGIRQRAEVFVNEKLVGYELAQQTPFEVDITDVVHPGAGNKLAVRITDPNGVFSWGDFQPLSWGNRIFPSSHGFSGILGTVVLKTVGAVHVSDVFVKNKPTLRDVDADMEITNDSARETSGTVEVRIVEAWLHGVPVAKPQTVYAKPVGNFSVKPGERITVSQPASVPAAKLWGMRDGNLYNYVVTLKDAQGKVLDEYAQRFGFRFLSVEGYGSDARYYLNGKREFFLSAISWGFWPINGIFPTPELARKHIESAFALGLNMLNFHRCEGNGLVLDAADEMGMLYYEEPGGYYSPRPKSDTADDIKAMDPTLAIQLNTVRLMRMIRRDRNHPSLVIYNMVNEPMLSPDDQAAKDMAAAHLLDPTRMITYGSGFMNPKNSEPAKLHMIPYDQTQRNVGFTDIHNAGNSPGVYTDSMYNSPTNFLRNERDQGEIFMWGEEGAIASPPQLELIQKDIEKAGHNGWDGADYKEWYQAYVDYLKNKGLTKYYPSLTGLITSLGNIMYYEHGRLLENVRIADGAEINVLNGYEDMKLDNFSGAVDVFRNLKGDPTLISQYMRPLFVAVKARNKIGEVGDTNLFDMFVINEHAIPAGEYTVRAGVTTPQGASRLLYTGKVKVSAGDKFSDLAAEKIAVPLNAGKGYYAIRAELLDATGKPIATGHEEIFAVDWKSDRIAGKGAVLGGSPDLMHFAVDAKKANVVPYKDDLGRLDYIVAGSIGQEDTFKPISAFDFRTTDRNRPGLNLDYFRGQNFEQRIDQRISTATLGFNLEGKPIPGYDILGNSDFSLRWEGFLIPEVSGSTEFELRCDDGAKIWLDGKVVADAWQNGPARTMTFKVELVAGKSIPIKIEAYQATGTWEFALRWKPPVVPTTVDIEKMLKRVHDDGTKLIILEGAENWVNDLKSRKVLPDFKIFHPSKTWVGSNYFVRQHPFFQDLPVNGGMNWEYQTLVMYDGPNHFGLYDMNGEEPVVSLVGGSSHLVATSVGVVPYGRGKIAFSDLDLAPNLSADSKASAVPKKIFCNLLKWGSQP